MILPQTVIHSAQGQDRSNFQPVTPWTGNDFGFCKATEGTTFTDATFAANWRNLKLAGIPRGAYAFWHPLLDPVLQARFFVDTVMKQGLMPGDILVADIEITAGSPMTRMRRALGQERLLPRQNLPADVRGLTASSLDIRAKAFLDEVSALAGPHNPVLVYTNLSVGSLLRSCTGYELWIAYPSNSAPASVAPWRTWRFWQWGTVSGVDRDAYNGTKADLLAWAARFKPQPKPPPPPAVPVPSIGDAMFSLPVKAGDELMVPVPPAVLHLSGPVMPTVLRISAPAPVEFEFRSGATWTPMHVDADRSPQEFPLSLVAAQQPAVKIRCVSSPVQALGDFA